MLTPRPRVPIACCSFPFNGGSALRSPGWHWRRGRELWYKPLRAGSRVAQFIDPPGIRPETGRIMMQLAG